MLIIFWDYGNLNTKQFIFYKIFIFKETLLKNHYQMFQIVDKDKVKLKIWTATNIKEDMDSCSEMDDAHNSTSHACATTSNLDNKCLKTKTCLFDLYHPDGCLLNDLTCSYIHNKK